MYPAETRLKELEEALRNETDQNSLYAQDLKLSIKQAKADVKRSNKAGYRMVEG